MNKRRGRQRQMINDKISARDAFGVLSRDRGIISIIYSYNLRWRRDAVALGNVQSLTMFTCSWV